MNEQFGLEFQLSFLKKLHKSTLSVEEPQQDQVVEKNQKQPVLVEKKTLSGENERICDRFIKLDKEEKREIYQLSRITDKAGVTLRGLISTITLRHRPSLIIEEIELIWETFGSPQEKFELYTGILQKAFREMPLEDYLQMEKEIIVVVGRKMREDSEYPAEIDDFLLKLLNSTEAVDLAYRAAKANGDSVAIAALALSGLKNSQRALSLAVKVGRPAVLKELKAVLDEKRTLSRLFCEEAQRQFEKLLPSNPKVALYSKEKMKRLFSPLLVVVPSRPELMSTIIANFGQLPPDAAESLKEKLETLFLVLKSSKLEEAVRQILRVLKEEYENPRIKDLLNVIMQTRVKRPQIYQTFVKDLQEMFSKNRTTFLELSQRLDLPLVIDVFLQQYETRMKFDAASLSEVLQSAHVSPTTFLCGLAFRTQEKIRLAEYCVFLSNFVYFYSSQLNVKEFVDFVLANAEKEFPTMAFYVTLLFAEEEKKRTSSIEIFVIFFRKAVYKLDYDFREVWDWVFRLYELDQIVFKENIAIEMPEGRRVEFFEKLSKNRRFS